MSSFFPKNMGTDMGTMALAQGLTKGAFNMTTGAMSSMANKAKTAAMSHPYAAQASAALANAQNKLVTAAGIKCNCDAIDPAKNEAAFNLANNVAWIGWKGNNTGLNDTADPNNKNFADGVFSLISRYNAVCGSDKKKCGERWARTLRAIAKNESRLGKYGVTNTISNAWSATKNMFSKKPQQQAGIGSKYRRKRNKTNKRNRK
jgi:hypothetical protein